MLSTELPVVSVSELRVIHTELAEIHGKSRSAVRRDVGSAS